MTIYLKNNKEWSKLLKNELYLKAMGEYVDELSKAAALIDNGWTLSLDFENDEETYQLYLKSYTSFKFRHNLNNK